MKKIILLLIVIICSGCGKKLTCTYKENFDDVKISNKIVFNFKDNTYKEKDIMVFKDNDEAKKYYDDIAEYIDLYNLVLDKNKIVSNMDGEIKLNGSKKDIRNQYESYDYKCR